MSSQRPNTSLLLDERLLRRLIEGSNLAIQVYRLEDPADLGSFRFLDTNPAAALHAGVSYHALREDLGKTFREFVPDILLSEAPARYHRVLQTGRPDSWDLRYGDAKYPAMILRVYAWPLDERTVAIAFTNITEQYETQRRLDENVAALRRAYDDLETSRSRQVQAEKLASLGQMSAGVAHEINNPLLVVQGYAARIRELLATETLKQREALEQCLSRLERSCARIETIANRMSSYSRYTQRATTRLPLNAVAREAAELLRPDLHSRGIALELALCSSEPEIVANELRLEQLIVNLLLNARDAVVERGGPGHIEVSSQLDAGEVLLRVRDDGTGITEEVQRKMFDPFFSTKPPGAGTGLGLSIVHEIAQELAGRVDWQSAPGHGSTFTLIVPVAPAVARVGSSSP